MVLTVADQGLMTSLMTSSRNNLVANLGLNILQTRPDSGMVPKDSLQELAYGLSIAHAADDVT